jgi:hypothetical protein
VTLFGVWARSSIQLHQRMRNEQLRLQAVRLAEAGIRRALAMRTADASYNQERWQVPASDLNTTHTAAVRIRVTPGQDSPALTFEATAEFPAGAIHRAQVTRRIEIPNSVTGEEP